MDGYDSEDFDFEAKITEMSKKFVIVWNIYLAPQFLRIYTC